VSNKSVLWTLPLRLGHWGLAVIVILNLFWLEDGDQAHRWLGYAAVGIVGLRFLQGIWGAPHERFSSFPLGWPHLKKFLLGVFSRGGQDPYRGHNPLASWIYILMWLGVLGLGLSGWIMGWDIFFGDERLHDIHTKLSDLMIGLLVLHVLGMLYDTWRYRRATLLSMFTGHR
jgi:cytochrome b